MSMSSSPDDGHQFHFAVVVQGSYAVGDGPHIDADLVATDAPFKLTVRAWNLADACQVAAATPLAQWTHEEIEVQWGVRHRSGQLIPLRDEEEARAMRGKSLTHVCRVVGPWIEVPRV